MKKSNKNITLSLVINTKNEENNIADCINSARDIVDEIIVVDMQSTDKTVDIAKKLGVQVYSVKDYHYADPARNFAINKASGKWILVMDADERLPSPLSQKIIEIIKANKFDVVEIPFKNIHFNEWIKHTAWWPDYQDRLFRKGYVNCPGEVHTRYKIKGRILTLEAKEENAMIHYQTKTVSGWVAKMDRYTSLENSFEHKKNITIENALDYFEKEFVWRFIEKEGYLDGMRGFVLSKLMEFYRFLVFAKYWEKKNFPELCTSSELKKAVEHNQKSSVSEREIVVLKQEIDRLKNDLTKIQNSKFYKIWQLYCQKRDSLLHFKRLSH